MAPPAAPPPASVERPAARPRAPRTHISEGAARPTTEEATAPDRTSAPDETRSEHGRCVDQTSGLICSQFYSVPNTCTNGYDRDVVIYRWWLIVVRGGIIFINIRKVGWFCC